MKILIATDSRGVIPSIKHPAPGLNRNWVNFLLEDYRKNIDDVTYYRAVDEVYVFTLALLKKHILDKKDDFYDLAIIQAGWHEYICPWPINLQKTFYPDSFDDKYILETNNEDKCRYFNKQEIIDIVQQIKQISKHQLFIGMQSLLNIPSSIIGAPIHQQHILESNNEFSSLNTDFFCLPNHKSWANKYCGPDRIHYLEHSGNHVASYISRYISRIDETINSKLLNNNYHSSITINKIIYSYKEFIDRCIKIGSSLSKITHKNDIILISKNTSIDQLELFIGSILYGRIPVFIQPNTTKVETIFLEQKLSKLKQVLNPKICFCEYKDINVFKQYFTSIVKLTLDNKIEEINIPNKKDIAFIQLSSGTTGIPKIISVTHQQLIEHCDEYANYLNLNNKDYISSWLPLYHDMGLIACFLMPLLHGISFSHIDPFKWLINPQLFFDDIIQNKTTLVWFPNFAFAKSIKDLDKNLIIDLSSIRQLISCSEPISFNILKEFYEKFQNVGLKITSIKTCYALAENIFAVSQSDEIKYYNNTISCGKLLPGTSVMIYNGEDKTEEEIGNIYIKSSYQPQSKIEDTILGYYNTGDIGFMIDEELFVIGRDKDKIISFGINYFPYEFEEIVSKISGIIPGRVICFGIYNENIGTEEIIIAAETKIPSDIIKLQIYNQLNNLILKVILVEPEFLVKTSSGKINRINSKNKLIENGYIKN